MSGIRGAAGARATAVATAVAALMLVAGCGGSSGSASSGPPDNGESAKTGPVVAADAAAALESTTAVHIKGTFMDSGKQGNIDLQLQGKEVTGSLSAEGQTFEITETAGKTFLKGDAAFWTGNKIPASVAPQLAGKWVLVPVKNGESFTSSISVKDIAEELRKPEVAIQDPVTKGQENGQPVVVVSQADGSTLSVAASGKPYPLRLVSKGSDPEDIALTGFDQPQTIAAPPGALDLSTFGG